MIQCPVCGNELMVDENWELGRVSHCGIHYRKVERFDRNPTAGILDKSEGEGNDNYNHADQ